MKENAFNDIGDAFEGLVKFAIVATIILIPMTILAVVGVVAILFRLFQ